MSDFCCKYSFLLLSEWDGTATRFIITYNNIWWLLY